MKARLPKGVGGGANMQSMIKQAQKMQEDMGKPSGRTERENMTLLAGGGAVNVKINGKLEVLALDLKPEIVDPDDIETLSDILVAAMNEAIKTVNNTNSDEMGKITGGLNVPGMPGLF